MTDLDGTVSYSGVVGIECQSPADKIKVWPNPFFQSVNISEESISGGPAKMLLYDATGKILLRRTVQLREGNNQFSLHETDNLPAGIYYLRFISEEKTAHFKLIKASN
jgi:hypothetical protein